MHTGKTYLRSWGQQRGFSLLELAIVLIIVALVTSMSITSGISTLESSKRIATENKLNYIEDALLAFRNSNLRLPCPADATLASSSTNFGIEAANKGSCTGGSPAANFATSDGGVIEGVIPVRTLNLPDEYMYDGWGRRIAYAVDTHMTDVEAFNTTSLPDQCGITINDGNSGTRSAGAMYALLSLGPSGHGGFLKGGTRQNSGLTDADSLTDCHCSSAGVATAYNATYVLKEPTGTPGTAAAFDVLLHFKERWQLLGGDDQTNFSVNSWYVGPRLLAGFQSSGSDSAYAYKLQCGRLQKQTSLDPVATSNATGVAFTPGNNYMLVFSNAGCELYPLTYGGRVVGTGSGAAVPSCPAYNPSVKVAMSDNGYLAITQTPPPYIKTWKMSGGSFVAMSAIASPGSQPTSLSMSENYMVISNDSYMKFYNHTSTAYTLGTQPPTIPSHVSSSAVAPNEAYVAATVDGNIGGTPAPKIYLWKINSATSFTALSTISIASNDTPAGLAFSPDGKYMAVGGAGGDNAVLYKIEAADVFTRLASPTGWTNGPSTAGTNFSFSPDSRYIAMTTSSNAHPLILFRRVSATEYKFSVEPDSAPGVAAGAVAFAH